MQKKSSQQSPEPGPLVARTIDFAASDLRAIFARIAPQIRAFYRHTPDSDCIEILGIGIAAQNTSGGTADFAEQYQTISKHLLSTDAHTRQNAKILGWTAFDPAHPQSPEWNHFPRRTLYIPEIILTRRAHQTTATIIGRQSELDAIWQRHKLDANETKEPRASKSQPQPTFHQTTWLDRDTFFRGIHHVVHENTAPKVVLARRALVETTSPIRLHDLLNTLAKNYPTCTLFAISAPENTTYPVFLGATPERLAHVRDRKLQTMALAGTAQHPDHALVDSTKELEEHYFVRDMITDALQPISSQITTAPAPTIHHLANVSHLLTPISATLKPTAGIADAVQALHPTPAVCGTPTDLARQQISQFEGFDRGLYAGAFGWMDLEGNGEFDVALRCGLIGPAHALLFAGAGITTGSDPDAEWTETHNKFAPLLNAISAQSTPQERP